MASADRSGGHPRVFRTAHNLITASWRRQGACDGRWGMAVRRMCADPLPLSIAADPLAAATPPSINPLRGPDASLGPRLRAR